MDLSNLLAIYGNPTVSVCPACQGKGCSECDNFGFIGQTNTAGVVYSYSYPMYVALKKRDHAIMTRNILLGGLTALFVLSIIISYIINFRANG
jgi:hypothetical protein